MHNENFHPICKEPPLAHALHRFDEKTGILTYEYNGVTIITVDLKQAGEAGYRHGSDGSIQSIQYIQQIYITTEKPIWASVTFCLSADAINMRPHRAGSNEAILGQTSGVLIEGVNGLYDAEQDLLIDFNGCPWRWKSKKIQQDEYGHSIIKLEVELSEKPFFINLRMQYYRKHLGYSYYKPWERKTIKSAPAGWCSWEAYRRHINEENIRDITGFLEKELKPWGLEYIQVDDGYQKMPLPYDAEITMAEGWMGCDEEKFPDGHHGIVKDIREKGLKPAIWVNANITNPEFPEKNPHDILWFEGKPLHGEWIDLIYSCTPETLKKHVTPLFRSLKEAGYEYVKIDAIRHLLFDGLHEAVRLGIMSNDEAEAKFRAFMEAGREGLGEDIFYLASWGEMHEVVGVCDACRIAMDANPTWAGIHMQLFESARWFFSQRILFVNDPDHACIRTKYEWAQSLLSLISLSGGLYMLSDAKEVYTPERLELIRKTLPPLQTRTAETGPISMDYPAYTWTKLHGFAVQSNDKPVKPEDITLKEVYDMAGIYPGMNDDHPFSSLWAFHLESEALVNDWCVMGRFATVPLHASNIKMGQLGLSEKKQYHAFDFWKETYLGVVQDNMDVPELNVGECQIVALHEVQDVPQFIASTRHVSMDAVSVLNCNYENGVLNLRLQGVIGYTEKYYFSGNGMLCTDVQMQGAKVNWKQEGELVCLEVTFCDDKANGTIAFQ